MDSREAWQYDGEGLKTEVLDLARARHEMQSRMVVMITEMFTRDTLGGKGFRAIAQWLHLSTNLRSVNAASWWAWRGCSCSNLLSDNLFTTVISMR